MIFEKHGANILRQKSMNPAAEIAFLNRRTDGTPSEVSVILQELGLTYPKGYKVTELFDNRVVGIMTKSDTIRVSINPTGVVIIRANLLTPLAQGPIVEANRPPQWNPHHGPQEHAVSPNNPPFPGGFRFRNHFPGKR